MNGLRHDIQSHQQVAMFFWLAWVVLWGITVLTWWYDTAGYSLGMPGTVTILHFFLPLGAGILAGWWQRGAVRGLKHGLLVGLLVSAVDMLVMYAWSGVLIGQGKAQPDPDMTVWSGLFEALMMGVFTCVTGLILGALGGLIAGAISAGPRPPQTPAA